MDLADEYASSPTHRSSPPTALPRRPSPVASPRPSPPPLASPSGADGAPEWASEGPVGAAEALGQEAATEEVEEIPRVLPHLGLQGGAQEEVKVAWVEGDQPSVISEEKEDEELGKLFDLSLEAQELIKVSVALCTDFSIFFLPSDESSRLFFLCRAWDNASR